MFPIFSHVNLWVYLFLLFIGFEVLLGGFFGILLTVFSLFDSVERMDGFNGTLWTLMFMDGHETCEVLKKSMEVRETAKLCVHITSISKLSFKFSNFKYGKVLKTTTGSVEIPEAQAIIERLSFALENGITYVCVESDSKKVIDNCEGKIARGDWGFYPSLCRIQDLKSKFSAVRWTWIPREANAVADAASAIAFGGMGTEVWVDRPHPPLFMFCLVMGFLAHRRFWFGDEFLDR